MLKAAQAYFQTQVTTTSQGQLLLMLYDGAIKFLKQAKVKIGEKSYAEKGILISKAIDVISELDGSLNCQKGGDLAQNLHNLYFFCNTRLLQANMKMDTKLIDDVIGILDGLRDAFAQITDTAPQPQLSPQQRASRGRPMSAPQSPPAMHAKTLPHPAAAARGAYAAPAPVEKQAPESQQRTAPSAAPRQTPPVPDPQRRPPAQQHTPAPDTQNEAAAKTVAPEAAPHKTQPPAQHNNSDAAQPPRGKLLQSKLLAGSNIYKKMSSQS